MCNEECDEESIYLFIEGVGEREDGFRKDQGEPLESGHMVCKGYIKGYSKAVVVLILMMGDHFFGCGTRNMTW